MVTIPDWLAPSHWHNDACPSWRAEIAGGSVSIFVDYADAAAREFPETPRYVVLLALGDHSGEEYAATDNWAEAVAALDSARAILIAKT